MARENRSAFRERLRREGRWQSFKSRRAFLATARGLPEEKVDAQVRAEFRPLPPKPTPKVAPVGGEDESAPHRDAAARRTEKRAPVDAAPAAPLPVDPSSPRAVIQWIFDHIKDPAVVEKDAPAPGAWSFLQRIEQDGKLQSYFYTNMWAKIVPKATDDAASKRFSDDGRAVIELIEKVEEAARASVLQHGPKRTAGKLSLQASHP